MDKRKRQKGLCRRRMADTRGNIRQKGKFYYYRLTVANGIRKEFALHTSDYDEAFKKALELDNIWDAPNKDVAMAQMSAIKGFSKQADNLPFNKVWEEYSVHPDRATPHTISEQISYKKTFDDFVQFVSNPVTDKGIHHTIASGIADVTPRVCEEFAAYLRTTNLAVVPA